MRTWAHIPEWKVHPVLRVCHKFKLFEKHCEPEQRLVRGEEYQLQLCTNAISTLAVVLLHASRPLVRPKTNPQPSNMR
jgi:hypothetical protein